MANEDIAELRSALFRLIASVVVLDAIVIAIYYALDVKHTADRTQKTFVAVWLVLTLLVVATGMKRVRAARVRIRGRR